MPVGLSNPADVLFPSDVEGTSVPGEGCDIAVGADFPDAVAEIIHNKDIALVIYNQIVGCIESCGCTIPVCLPGSTIPCKGGDYCGLDNG